MSPSNYTPPDDGRVPGRSKGGQFSGPILSGEVYVPSRRDQRKRARRAHKRSRGSRLLRWGIGILVVILVIGGALWGYNRYEWDQVSSSPCTVCVAPANGGPYNVLIIGSDSRAGESAADAQHFGNASNAGGQRSDTIKIVHVDPKAGTAQLLSIPRDTYVQLSGLPAGTGLSADNKINAAFNNGPDGLIQTIQNTFGIPISHYVVLNFFGLQDAVNALGGVNMDFPYPVRDQYCDPNTGICNNESGLSNSTTGCQTLNGAQALELSRSRYFQYYENGQWIADPTGDLGRIERQNLIIEAVLNKAKSTYNPLRLNSLLDSVVHDFSKDNGLTEGDLFSLVERYHAFSGSDLVSYTLPTSGASNSAGDVEVVDEPAAQQMLTAFLGTTPNTVTTPPIDAYGNAIAIPAIQTTPTTSAPSPSTKAPSSPTTAPTQPAFFYDPKPC